MHLLLPALQTGHAVAAKSRVTQFVASVVGILFTLGFSLSGYSQAPTLTMAFPEYNSSYIAGSKVNILTNATTPAGTTIDKVEFFTATSFSGVFTKIGEATAPSSLTPLQYSLEYTLPAPASASGSSRQFRAVVTNSVPISVTQTGNADRFMSVTVYPSNYSVAPRTFYVAASGSNTSPYNSLATAARSIQTVASIVAPGDIVLVTAGTYTSTASDIVSIRRTGMPDKPIVFRPNGTDKPKLQMGDNNWNAINVLPGSAYVRIEGFEVNGNNANLTLAQARAQVGACEGTNPSGTPIARFNGNGISINGAIGTNSGTINRPHHITIANNNVHDCAGGGIGGGQTDYLTVEDNITANNSWYTVYGTSGLNIISAWNYDNSTDTKIIFRRNRSYGNKLLVAWNVRGDGSVCRFYDGNGVILDNNNASKNIIGEYFGKFLIENNVCYLNGGRGININFSDNAIVLNNTTYQNGQSDGGQFIGIESEIIAQGGRNLNVYNNIFYGKPGEKTVDISNTMTNVQHNNNLTFGGTGTSYFTGAQNKTGQDPLFVNAAGGDFQIPNNSPAINAGSNTAGQFAATDILGLTRPQGTSTDIGAFELVASALPVTLSQFTAKPLGERVSVAWSTATEQNSAYFEVERSSSLAEFSRIGRIEAAGESKTTRSYGLLDEKPLAGANYYRLKQVDRDGSMAYSKIVSVVMDHLTPSLEVMGNPTETSTIRVVTRNLDGATYLLTTATGQPISLTQKPEPNGELVLMPAQPLPTGIYLIQARNGALHLTRKVLVR